MKRFCILALLVVLFASSLAQATQCKTDDDCGVCQQCGEHGLCTNVAPMTDPRGECPTICGVKMVCGEEPHCILNEKLGCVCDWERNECIGELTVEVEETMEEDNDKQKAMDLSEDTTVIDVLIEEDEQDNTKKYENAKNRWGIHIGVAVMMGIAGVAAIAFVGLFIKFIIVMGPTKGTDGLWGSTGDSTSESDDIEDQPKQRRFDPPRGKRRIRKSRDGQKTGSSLMSEISLGDKSVLFVPAYVDNDDGHSD